MQKPIACGSCLLHFPRVLSQCNTQLRLLYLLYKLSLISKKMFADTLDYDFLIPRYQSTINAALVLIATGFSQKR